MLLLTRLTQFPPKYTPLELTSKQGLLSPIIILCTTASDKALENMSIFSLSKFIFHNINKDTENTINQ